MSCEVIIKRSTGMPSLTADDFARIVKEGGDLSGGEREPIVWTDPTSGRKRYINVVPESGELSTADMQGDEDSVCRFLDKLRMIAALLDARVIAEGEDITDLQTVSPKRAGCSSAVVCLAVFVAATAYLLFTLR